MFLYLTECTQPTFAYQVMPNNRFLRTTSTPTSLITTLQPFLAKQPVERIACEAFARFPHLKTVAQNRCGNCTAFVVTHTNTLRSGLRGRSQEATQLNGSALTSPLFSHGMLVQSVRQGRSASYPSSAPMTLHAITCHGNAG